MIFIVCFFTGQLLTSITEAVSRSFCPSTSWGLAQRKSKKQGDTQRRTNHLARDALREILTDFDKQFFLITNSNRSKYFKVGVFVLSEYLLSIYFAKLANCSSNNLCDLFSDQCF